MPDGDAARNAPLTIKDVFPPVPTPEWEAAIRRDLKGADYGRKLIWRTEEGIEVRPYYRAADLEPLGELANLAPGQFPYTRGSGQPWEEAQDWRPPAGAIRADLLHDAGATAVQELGWSLAEAVEKLSGAPAGITFVFAAGSTYFMEIAKLRAARLVWANAVQAFGTGYEKYAPAHVHVRTARSNKSVYDPHTNLLRAATEALSAVLGGADSLTVEPWGFEPRLALNVQRILREEAHAGRVADPAGGAYFIEALTDSLAREAWKVFQQVEAGGGWSKALAAGSIEESLEASRAAKAKAVASRRRTLVGVNNYPDLREKDPAPAPAGEPNPFGEFRLAEPFERIRRRTDRHARETGRRPRVLLLKRGDVRMKMARANFCLNFFGCAGFEIAESDTWEGEAADLVVLCSSDAEYLALAREVCPAAKAPVLVAGNPKEQAGALAEAGVAGFVHVASNAVETLTGWQNRLGMKE